MNIWLFLNKYLSLKIFMDSQKIKVLQITPYYPPHKWWLELVAFQRSQNWTESGSWNVLNITTSLGQEEILDKIWNTQGFTKIWENYYSPVCYKNRVVGYNFSLDWISAVYQVLCLPSFDVIPNFPFPKFWTGEFRYVFLLAKQFDPDVIQTHTRFFLTSFFGWLFARKHKKKRVHIEHGSDFVRLKNKFFSFIAYAYDQSLGKFVFAKADKIIAISDACKKFIQQNFKKKEVEVIYNWTDFKTIQQIQPDLEFKKKFPDKIIVWALGRLIQWKWFHNFVQAYYLLPRHIQEKVQFVLIWWWEEFENLKKLDTKNKIYFTGLVSFQQAISIQKIFDIYVHCSYKWWGLATTILQAMALWNFIVSTYNEGADEVIFDWRNGIIIWDSSAQNIAAGLIEALKLLPQKEKYAARSQKILETSFDPLINIKKYYSIYLK